MTESSESARAQEKPVKLRESCDSCLLAKVRCSKARPLCRRCLSNGAPCAYSPSSRTAKRSRNAGGVAKSTRTSTVRLSATTRPRSLLPPNTSNLTRPVFPLFEEEHLSLLDIHNDVIAEGLASLLLQEQSTIGTFTAENITTIKHDGESFDTSNFLPSPFFNDVDLMGPFMPLAGSNPFDNLQAESSSRPSPDQSTVSPAWASKDNSYLRMPQFQSPLDVMPVGPLLSTLTTPRPDGSIPPPPLHSQYPDPNDQSLVRTIAEKTPTCDCFAACLHALHSLHNHSWLSSSNQQGGPPFDIVLTINREAIESFSTLLECAKCISKSGRSIVTMMLATIFGKVISLYRAACFLRFGPSTSKHESAQLAFGAYMVTGEHRQLLEIEILLLELRKAERVLQVYSARFRNGQPEQDSETGVYDALTSYLDKNLRYIVGFLQLRKSAASR